MPRKKSSKPSNSNASKSTRRERYQERNRRERQPIIFLDANTDGLYVQRALQLAGVNFRTHRNVFHDGTQDVEWIPVVAAKSWFVITRDERILRNRVEFIALKKAGLGFFCIATKDITGPQMAEVLVRAWPNIKRTCEEQSRPFVAKIHRDGAVVVTWPSEPGNLMAEEKRGKNES